jgi:hypothetical protein
MKKIHNTSTLDALFVLGRSRYAQNLDLLVPFFDSPPLELENIEKVRIFAFLLASLQLCVSTASFQ